MDWHCVNAQDAGYVSELSNEEKVALAKAEAYSLAASFFANYMFTHRHLSKNWSWIKLFDMCILAFENSKFTTLDDFAESRQRTGMGYRRSYAVPFISAAER